MFFPSRVKYRKEQKRVKKGVDRSGTYLAFGNYGLKAMEPKWINSKQIEACRRVIIRFLKKGGKLWVRIFPNKPVTRKGNEVPMGGGKGTVDHYVFQVRPNRILFELDGIPEDQAREAFRIAASKLPIKTKFVKKEEL